MLEQKGAQGRERKLKERDDNRVVWYGANGWAVALAKERVNDLLLAPGGMAIESIDDAVEAYQCKLTVEGAPWLFYESDLVALQVSAKRAFGEACKFVSSNLEQPGIRALLDDVGRQYLAPFWALLGCCRAERRIDGQELRDLLIERPHCLGYILELEKFVKCFDAEVKEAMMAQPGSSAQLIIDRLATIQLVEREFHLPQSLANDDIDQIMLAYINGGHPNPNYLDVLSRWPNSRVNRYRPSSNVQIAAKKELAAAKEKSFQASFAVRTSANVAIDMDQKACLSVEADGTGLECTFGGQWLEAYLDLATVLNNCLYLLGIFDGRGLIRMSGHEHDESSFMALFGPRVLGEYRTSFASSWRGSVALVEVMAYEDFLLRRGASLEAALEWAYNTYFPEEYGIASFGISLPSVKASHLDRCKCIGSEFERAMKGYQFYQEYGVIDAERYSYEQFKSFDAARSLSEGHKYAVAGESFEPWASALFSNQSYLASLAYSQDEDEDLNCLFDLLQKRDIARCAYGECFQQGIDQLMERGLVEEDEGTGFLVPAEAACCMKLVWDFGAIVLKRYESESQEAIGNLVEAGILRYHDGLFTPDEAKYLNYMLNDSDATNSIGLRNKYAHANGPIADPNAREMRVDYHTMLTLFMSITLKINEELSDATGKGGLDPDDFVDWPLYEAKPTER